MSSMTIDLDKVTISTFEPHEGSSFQVRHGDQVRTATLTELRRYGREAPGGRESFALVFQFESSDVLPQAIYELTHDQIGAFSLFLVPVGQNENGVYYEAVFN